jgi:hypothetical protein
MAGKSITITFHVKDRSAKPVLNVEPRWWDADALCADPRFKMSNETGSYYDWSADLTVKEFRDLHEAFRPQATSGVYAAPDWQKIIQPKIKAMDYALAGAHGKISNIHVQVAEWESGLGD